MISTHDLSRLPAPHRLRLVLQSMAMLDALIEAEWQFRYYSFNAHWSPTEQMGSMRNGEGDDFFSVFDANGCFIKGFVHEASMSPYRTNPPLVWGGILDQVPLTFAKSLREPAFKISDTTFGIWRRPSDSAWQVGSISFPSEPDPDGSEYLLSALDGRPESYHEWAQGYYDRALQLQAVTHVYQHRPLTAAMLADLGSSRTLSELAPEADEIGYPSNTAA